MIKRINKDSKKPTLAPYPSKKLLNSLTEIEDYKKGKIKLETYNDVKSLRESLMSE